MANHKTMKVSNAPSINDKYPLTTKQESIILKDWAAGSAKQLETQEFIIRRNSAGYHASYETVCYAPAWWKIIDEPIVNALDHLVNNLGSSNPVTKLRIDFDKRGQVTVYNNGPGVDVAIHPAMSAKKGKDIWVPTSVFGILHQGSNKVRAPESIVGGTNGMGSKLSNNFSVRFKVETVDSARGLYFCQEWSDNRKVVHPPTIKPLSEVPALARCGSFTRLTFTPDYVGIFGYSAFTAETYALLEPIVRSRVFYASIYAHYTVTATGRTPGKKPQPMEVWFNDELVSCRSAMDLAGLLFPEQPAFKALITPENNTNKVLQTYPWDICAVVAPTKGLENNCISVVNGIVVRDGTHIRHMMNLVTNTVREKIKKIFKDKDMKFSPALVKDNIFLILNTKIPEVSWTSQSKDVLKLDNPAKLAGYKLPPKLSADLCVRMQERIIASICRKDVKPTRKVAEKVDYEKYTRANKCGGRESHKCTLIMVEGDSAASQVCAGVSNNVEIGFDYYGVISLAGVIMNVRTECTILNSHEGEHIVWSTKMKNNKLIRALSSVVGLNASYKYDSASPTYAKEMSELKYGCVVACVDQDLDGMGQILGLLLNLFELLWPNLLAADYVKWFCTPIIRAFPIRGGLVHAFYTLREYDEWETTVNISHYNANYYKGLATHSRNEVIHMFKTFKKHLQVYYTEADTRKMLNIYYGKNADLRKEELAGPVTPMDSEKALQQELTQRISVSDHLRNVTRLYQKDNIERKLDNYIDGQNQAGRKILDGIIKGLKGKTEMRVAQLGGIISSTENYDHGEASLYDSITNRGFVNVGGKQLPLIVPLSNFGSRKEGGKDAGSVRYIKTRLNQNIVNLIFPPKDYPILQFNFDEGKRSEPTYFVPIVPMAILESSEVPGTGWKMQIWARDVFRVIENVRRMIRLGEDAQLMPLPPTTYRGAEYEWHGELRQIGSDEYAVGTYSLNRAENSITIHELPLRKWTAKYLSDLRKKQIANPNIIEDINDKSDDRRVNIIVQLCPGALDIINGYSTHFTDGVEEYFKLRKRLVSFINLIGPQKEVITFPDYASVLRAWFPYRRDLYAARINRERILMQLQIVLLENTIRYVIDSPSLKLSGRKSAEMIEILKREGYFTIARGILDQPKFIPTDSLEDIILHGNKSNYDYLLDLSDRRKSAEALAEYQQKLDERRSELAEFNELAARGAFPGAEIWNQELTALTLQIIDGQKTTWLYGDASRFTFDD